MSLGCLTWVTAVCGGCDPVGEPGAATPRAAPGCGNGIVESPEACDLGFANAPDGPCRLDCQRPRCGDGVTDEGEECDDGNDDESDGCRNDCRRPIGSTWVRSPRQGERAETVFGLAPTADGGVIAVGEAQAGEGAATRAWLARYASDGELQWSRYLPEDDDTWDSATARAVVVDAQGDPWVTGYVHGERHDDLWLTRCEPGGTPRFTFIEDFSGNRDRGVALALYDDGVVVAGETLRHAQDRDGLVVAFDGQGERRWTYWHDGPAGGIDDARAVAVSPDGGVFAAGGEDGLTAWWLTKLDTAGEPLGYTRVRGEVGAWASALVVDADGAPWVAGTEVLAAPDPADPSAWHAQPFLARLDTAGRVRWTEVEPAAGAVRREAFGVVLDPGGGATMVGTDPLPRATCSRQWCPGRPWLASFDGQGRRRHALALDPISTGTGRAIARGPDGALWAGGAQRLVYSEADVWLGRYHEVASSEASP
ncbi:MAG: DUF4215 domain-containing protein [Myxococcota bacterium]